MGNFKSRFKNSYTKIKTWFKNSKVSATKPVWKWLDLHINKKKERKKKEI